MTEADPAEVAAVLDQRARAELGMSGGEFLDRLHDGTLSGCDHVAAERLTGIASLLDGDQPAADKPPPQARTNRGTGRQPRENQRQNGDDR